MVGHSRSTPQDGAWRPLHAPERALLHALTGQDFPGSTDLRKQIEHCVGRKGCECGCGTIALKPR